MNKKEYDKHRQNILSGLKEHAGLKEGDQGFAKGFWHGYIWALREKKVITYVQYSELDRLIYQFKSKQGN